MKAPKKPKGMSKKPAKPKEFPYPLLKTIRAQISQKQWDKYKKTKCPKPPYLMGLGGKSKKFLFEGTCFEQEIATTAKTLKSLRVPHKVEDAGSSKDIAERKLAEGGAWYDAGQPKAKLIRNARYFSEDLQDPKWDAILAACFKDMVKAGELVPARDGWLTNPNRFPNQWNLHANTRAQNRLIQVLRSKRKEIEELAKSCDAHWGFEDSFYRYYHQSFKVYYLQKSTEKIVGLLETIQKEAHLKELNSWFMEIIKDGTGKEFHMDHNQEWQKHTRPIVEAYFHAREMLRMAQKYGRELKEATFHLPSGWATLLYLYRMR